MEEDSDFSPERQAHQYVLYSTIHFICETKGSQLIIKTQLQCINHARTYTLSHVVLIMYYTDLY